MSGIIFGEGLGIAEPGFAGNKTSRSYGPGELDRLERCKLADKLAKHIRYLSAHGFSAARLELIRSAFDARTLEDAAPLVRAVGSRVSTIKSKLTRGKNEARKAKKAEKLVIARDAGALVGSRWFRSIYLKKDWEKRLARLANYEVDATSGTRVVTLVDDPTAQILGVLAFRREVYTEAYVRVRVFEEGNEPFKVKGKKNPKTGWWRDSWGRSFFTSMECRDTVNRTLGRCSAQPKAPTHSEVMGKEADAVLGRIMDSGHTLPRRWVGTPAQFLVS